MLSNGDTPAAGIELPACKERTSYSCTLSVYDYSTALDLTAETVQPFDLSSVCCYMHKALESLSSALEISPNLPICQLDILSNVERQLLLTTVCATTWHYCDDSNKSTTTWRYSDDSSKEMIVPIGKPIEMCRCRTTNLYPWTQRYFSICKSNRCYGIRLY
ncbi:hypothetical protein K7432_014845 [Basidiobolus ranarum]|uniref:Uncharacterized protein n=1 Tax=Basidiobolus ranarum TaxID=34480 RepID=A0ABR2VNY3_9FUNG